MIADAIREDILEAGLCTDREGNFELPLEQFQHLMVHMIIKASKVRALRKGAAYFYIGLCRHDQARSSWALLVVNPVDIFRLQFEHLQIVKVYMVNRGSRT